MRSTKVQVAMPGCAVDIVNCARLSPSGLTWIPPICRPAVNSTERRTSSVSPSIDFSVSTTLAEAMPLSPSNTAPTSRRCRQ
jgi:hypothetical protein